MTSELWMDIAGYEGIYQVSDLGQVRRIGSNCVLKQQEWMGYKVIWLRNKHQKKTKHRVHRLVATAFCPNPGGVDIVNHKDRDRRNNRATNLEWLTLKGNTAHWMSDDLRKMEAAYEEMEF